MVRLRNGRALGEGFLSSISAVKVETTKDVSASISKRSITKTTATNTKSSSKRKKVKQENKNDDTPGVIVPKNWEQVVSGIEEMRKERNAAVDKMGCDTYTSNSYPDHVNRFRTLIAAMLSSQTKDTVNSVVMAKLTSHNVITVQDFRATSVEDLQELLYPVSFYKTKAKNIKKTCDILCNENASRGDIVDIPNTLTSLMALPGVGPKMAHLVMTCAWNNTVGICVDIHVHRISNRLGWVRNTKNAEKTREELEGWLPSCHWGTINPLLVGFGQTICTPQRPKCTDCIVSNKCPSSSAVKK